MAVHKVEGENKWFFTCDRHLLRRISDRYDSKEDAEQVEAAHNKVAHTK